MIYSSTAFTLTYHVDRLFAYLPTCLLTYLYCMDGMSIVHFCMNRESNIEGSRFIVYLVISGLTTVWR